MPKYHPYKVDQPVPSSKIYCYDILKRYSYRQIGLDILDVSVLSLNGVVYAKDFQDI